MKDAQGKTPRSIALLVIAAIWAAGTLLLALWMPSTLASFREIFEGFGAATPPTTTMILNAPYVWWLLAASWVALFSWVAAKSRLAAAESKRMKLALGAIIAVTALACGFAAYWLYLPIFELGAAV